MSDTSYISSAFSIKRIQYRDAETGYTVAKAKFQEYDGPDTPTQDLVVTGHFVSIYEEDEFEAKGKWVKHDVFGNQFNVIEPRRVIPQTQKGLEAFLARVIKGVGKKTARRIVEHFGDETIAKIEESPKALLQVKGIGKKKAQQIHDKVVKHRKFEEIAMFVFNHGGNYRTAIKIYQMFGDLSIQKIRENPYILTSAGKIEFPHVDHFAKNLNFPYNHTKRIQSGLIYVLEKYSEVRGDLFLPLDELLRDFPRMIKKVGAYRDRAEHFVFRTEELNHAIEMLEASKQIVLERDENGEVACYLRRHYYTENRIVELLKERLNANTQPLVSSQNVDTFLETYEKGMGITFAENQKKAVHMATNHHISILTGGPGTGKTQTINTIIDCIEHYKPRAEIVLCAPTGRAAKRMTELTGKESKTIHRLAKINENQEDKEIIITGDILIVDEVSMADAYVFYRLLEVTDRNTRILLVGDHEQLPSVGPGLILRDLLTSMRIPSTRLNEVFRQALDSQIVVNSHKVIEGKTTKDQDGITFDIQKGDFFFVKKNDVKVIQLLILESVHRFVTKYNYSLDDIQILTPMKKGDLGVWGLNQLMQERFNPRTDDNREYYVSPTLLLREGDKVMQTKNNYDLEVFNGEVGKIISVSMNDEGEVEIEVEFPDKTIVYNEAYADELELAYCITIHKSQGSEYKIVIMPFHSTLEYMLTKNLIYTGWTRAKERVICIGDTEVLDRGVDRDDTSFRYSRIKKRLQEME